MKGIKMEEKKLIWQKYFNNCEFAFDFAGRKIKYSDYENEDSELAWSIDFMRSKNLNGPNNDLNMIPVHIKTKSEKANNINFLANGGFFKLKKSVTGLINKLICFILLLCKIVI